MAPPVIPDSSLPLYGVELHDFMATTQCETPTAKLTQIRRSKSLYKVRSPFAKLSQDLGEKTKRRDSQNSYSGSLGNIDMLDDEDYASINALRREVTEGDVGSRVPVIVEEVDDPQETLTMMNKLSALAKNPGIGVQEWKNKRADRIMTKKRQTQEGEFAGRRGANWGNQQGDCSCGPPGSCKLVNANKDVEDEEYEESDAFGQSEKRALYPRQIITAFGKTQGLITRKTSKRKGKGIETGKRNEPSAEYDSFDQLSLYEEDEENSPISPTTAWHPEFQYQPSPLCNCLLLSPQHEFSDDEIQKMRWFVDRMTRGLATPDEWLDDKTQCAWNRQAYRWNRLHPLRPRYLEYLSYYTMNADLTCHSPSPMTIFNKNWIVVYLDITHTNPQRQPSVKASANVSYIPPNARRASSPGRPKSCILMEPPALQPKECQPVFGSPTKSYTAQYNAPSNMATKSCTQNNFTSSSPTTSSGSTAATSASVRRHISDPKLRPNIPSRIPFVPVTVGEFIAGSDSPSQNSFTRPDLEIDTSVRNSYQTMGTPNNTPQTPASHYSSAIPCEDMGRAVHTIPQSFPICDSSRPPISQPPRLYPQSQPTTDNSITTVKCLP